MTRSKKKPEHYVDNKLFLEAMKEYRKSCNKAKANTRKQFRRFYFTTR